MGEERRGYLSLLLFGMRTSLDLTLSRNAESLFMCNVHESVKDCGATSYGVSVNHGTYTCIDPHQRLSIWHEFQYAKAVRLIVSCRVIRDEEYIFLHAHKISPSLRKPRFHV
jgi:hypothetical protein